MVLAVENVIQIDNTGIMYSIVDGNEGGSLAIDPLTGVITTTRPFDREEVEGLTITVEARNPVAQISDTAVVSSHTQTPFTG